MRVLLPLLLGISLAHGQFSSEPAELVRRLGSPSFEVRDAAETEILKLGLVALPALEQGTRDPDLEIRTRCLRLVERTRDADRKARIQVFLNEPEEANSATFPLWARYQALLPGKAQRKGFLAVYQTDPALIDLYHQDEKKGIALAGEKIRKLDSRLLLPQRDKEALSELPALLLLTADPQNPLDRPTLESLYAGLHIVSQRETLRKDLFTIPGTGEALLATLRRGGEAGYAITLPLAAELALPTARQWGLELLSASGTPPLVRAQSLLLLARVGTEADLPAITAWMEDKTAVGKVTVRGKNLQAELRDVALAVVLTLRGEKPAEYGFPYFEVVPGLKTLPSPERLGFADSAGRDAAFAKWKQNERK